VKVFFIVLFLLLSCRSFDLGRVVRGWGMATGNIKRHFLALCLSLRLLFDMLCVLVPLRPSKAQGYFYVLSFLLSFQPFLFER